jgi:hypothetical protein
MFLNRISWCIIYSWDPFNHIQVSLHLSSIKPEKQLSRKNIVYDKEKNILLITIK